MPKKLITTAIDYSSGHPHIGHALEKLSADVISRWHKLNGQEVFFLTGTDEHGQKVATKAKSANQTPENFAKEKSDEFEQMDKSLNLNFDRFIRTTDPDHIQTAQTLWTKCFEAGDIYKKDYEGLYCVGCESFKTKKDLDENGNCPDHQTKPELIKDENYFFKLSKYSDQIKTLLETDQIKLRPEARKNEILSFIKNGVEDISISRSTKMLEWGIPVPNDPDQVMYVWFDALTNYLTGAKWPSKENIWPADTHILGRDILRHHALLWPAMLLSAGFSKSELPKQIISHGMITVDGVKMSKSIGNAISPSDLISKFGQDQARWILLSEIKFLEDGDFSWNRAEVRNTELANNLGNLLSRTLTLAEKLDLQNTSQEITLKGTENLLKERVENFSNLISDFHFIQATQEISKLLDFANKFIDQKKPWELVKSDPDEAKVVISACFEILRQVTFLITPIMPTIAAEMSTQLGLTNWNENLKRGELAKILTWQAGQIPNFKKGNILFPKI